MVIVTDFENGASIDMMQGGCNFCKYLQTYLDRTVISEKNP
jgi:hypothetical protein